MRSKRTIIFFGALALATLGSAGYALRGWVLDRGTGALVRLAECEKDSASPVSGISSDGKTVFYLQDRKLWSVEPDTGVRRQRLPRKHIPPWYECTVDSAGTKALLFQGPSVYLLPLD